MDAQLYRWVVQLRRANFMRRAEGWVKGSLVLSELTVREMDDEAWAQALKRWRHNRR